MTGTPSRLMMVAWCALLPLAAVAQGRDAGDEPEIKPRAEAEVKLPAMPKPGNLLEFEPNAATRNRFFVDAESIAITGDGAVRYTLIVRSPSGAQNLFYEGIRCETFERKIYARGGSDGVWLPTRASEWQPVDYQDGYRQRRVLASDFFCRDNRMVKSRDEAIQRFKYPGQPTGGTTIRWRDVF